MSELTPVMWYAPASHNIPITIVNNTSPKRMPAPNSRRRALKGEFGQRAFFDGTHIEPIGTIRGNQREIAERSCHKGAPRTPRDSPNRSMAT